MSDAPITTQSTPDARETTQTDPTTTAPADAQTQPTTDAQPQHDKKWSDEDLKRSIAINVARDREERAQKAEQERLKAEAQWQKLAEQHEARLTEQTATITALEERLAERDKLLTSHLKTEMKTWPEKYQKAALDGIDDGDAVALAAAIKRIRPLVDDAQDTTHAAGITGTIRPVTPGNPPNPPPARRAAAADADRAAREAHTRLERAHF